LEIARHPPPEPAERPAFDATGRLTIANVLAG
jgi:hypothetical protein